MLFNEDTLNTQICWVLESLCFITIILTEKATCLAKMIQQYTVWKRHIFIFLHEKDSLCIDYQSSLSPIIFHII